MSEGLKHVSTQRTGTLCTCTKPFVLHKKTKTDSIMISDTLHAIHAVCIIMLLHPCKGYISHLLQH